MYLSKYIYQYIYLLDYMYFKSSLLQFKLYTYLFDLFINLYLSIFIYLSLTQFIYLSIYLTLFTSIYPLHLSYTLSIYLSIQLHGGCYNYLFRVGQGSGCKGEMSNFCLTKYQSIPPPPFLASYPPSSLTQPVSCVKCSRLSWRTTFSHQIYRFQLFKIKLDGI